MIRYVPLEAGHLDRVVERHLETWASDTLSVVLGPDFLRAFYTLAIEDPNTHAVVALRGETEEPSAWCLGFRDYAGFNEALSRRLGLRLHWMAFRALLRGRLRPAVLLDHFLGADPGEGVDRPDRHLGAFGRLGDGFEDFLVLSNLIKYVAERLCEDAPACWAVTQIVNKGARTAMRKAGFAEFRRVVHRSGELVAYEFSR